MFEQNKADEIPTCTCAQFVY